MNQPVKQPLPVHPIEAMYALEAMGRGPELTRLMELELPRLEALLNADCPNGVVQVNHQMLRFGLDYVLSVRVLKDDDVHSIDVYLNVSSSAFMVKFGAKQFSLITAKSIGQLIFQLIQHHAPKHPEMSLKEISQSKTKHLSM